MSTPAILVTALANSSHVSNPSRSILSALLSHCADHTELSNFLLASLAQRIHALRAEGFRVLCACGCGEFVEPDPWEEQAEALNEEMSSWLADFVLILVGKRKEYLKKLVWWNDWCSELEGTEVDGRTAEWIRMREMEYRVLQRAERGHVRDCALTGRTGNTKFAQIIPVSQNPGRFDRFVELANVFFSGRYAESLTKEILFSTRNAFMLHANWLTALDRGELILKQFERKVYAVGASYGAHSRLRSMASYDFQAGGAPINISPNALDSELMQLHAAITRLWLEIDLSHDIVADIDALDNMPASLQAAHLMTPENFDNTLRHKLMLL